MKNLLVGSLVLASSFSLANEIKVDRQAHPVRVNSVSTELIGEGFPMTQVKVNATFGNKCMIPRSGELVTIVQYSKNFEVLEIALGQEVNRACTMEYMPVTVTIDLGQYAKPNDGTFERVIVNGKEAVAAQN